MKRLSRLKREVATGLGAPSGKPGGRRPRPNTGTRRDGLVGQAVTRLRAGALAMWARARTPAAPRPAKEVKAPSPMQEMVSLAWPIAAGMLGETALGLVDTKLVGGLGPAALGGVGMATILLFLGYSMTFGLMRGVKVRGAYAVGEGQQENAIRYAQVGVIFGACAGVMLWLVSQDLYRVLGWLNVDPSLIPATREYLSARSLGAVSTCAVAALIQYRQGIGDSRTPMLVGLGGNLVNAALAYALIYGKLGLPALGVRGAGYGTAITETLELLVMLAVVAREQRGKKAPTISLREAAREVGSLGVPTALHFGLEILAFTVFTAILGSFGATQMAAHQIAMNTIRVSFLPGVAIAEAASVLVARALAQKSLAGADRVTRAALFLGVGFMSGCGVLFALFGASVVAVFSDDPEVISIGRRLFLAAAVFQTMDAANIVLRGALRGAKDVRWVAVIGITVAWASIPMAAYVLGRLLGWGALGGWIGFIVETTLGASLLYWRWAHGAWRRSFAETPEPTPAPGLAPVVI